MGGISLPGFLTHIFLRRFGSEEFFVLDIGTFSVKALYITKSKDRCEIWAHSLLEYTGGDITSEGNINKAGIVHACALALTELKKSVRKRGGFSRKVVLGIGGGFVHGKTMSHNYIRERPADEIDKAELANIIQRVEQRAYEQVRRHFRKETARSELDVRIVNAAVQEIKLDGYQVVNPLSFAGKEIGISLFNAYISKAHLAVFEDIVAALKLDIASIVSEPYAVFQFLSRNGASPGNFILIDIGGSITEICLARKGKFEDAKSIPFGGSSFTKNIAENLKVSFEEAESIKRRLAEGGVSKRVEKKLEDIVSRDTELFTRALEEVLNEFSQLALLPSSIYVYGGGSAMETIGNSLRRKKWRSGLSFYARPSVEVLRPPAISAIPYLSLPNAIRDVSWTVPVSLAYAYTARDEREGEIIKALRRSLRLIQG